MAKFSVSGSSYQFLAVRFNGKVIQTNTVARFLTSTFYYRYTSGAASTVGIKAALVTTAVTGFKDRVVTPLLAALSVRWVSIGVDARWIDVYDDQWAQASAFATVGGVAGDGLPLEDCVTVRKGTGIRGKSYKGSWHFAPIAENETINDELSDAGGALGITLWTAVRAALAQTISDGASVFSPVLLSSPIGAGANYKLPLPLVMVGADLVGPLIVNATIGEMKRRKEKPTITF